MDISQTFPLMNDETVRPLVFVMSIAVFELWRTRRTVRREEEKKAIFDWSRVGRFPQSLIISESSNWIAPTLVPIQINDYVITDGNNVSKGDGGKKLGRGRQDESRPNRVPRIAPRKNKAVCHELALESEREEHQLAST